MIFQVSDFSTRGLQVDYEQDITFHEYCLWRRDQYVDTCVGFDDNWTAAAEGNCDFARNDKCIKLTDAKEFDLTAARSTDYKKYMKARNQLQRRPGWGNVYNYAVMYGDYQTLEDSSESFMGDCQVFYDFVYALDSPNDDETNDDY